ncbi:MAG: riboflavin biosynthesis protein RibF [Clostridia bacterium]|nr:MAG: riboflavin biosynthesis protein RibF [Clostridia bacterium]
MTHYRLPAELCGVKPRERVLAIGMFDGVHIGHRAVLTAALLQDTLSPAVFTFSYADAPKKGVPLQTEEERQRLLEQMGFADLFCADFSAVCDMTPAAFVDMLYDALSVRSIVCGFNFRFGKNGAGDTAVLKTLCEKRGIRLAVQPPVMADGVSVSSTRIKDAFAVGDIEKVRRLLGRAPTVCAAVISGQHLGHTLGSPTINQPLADTVLPRFGVYAAVAQVDGRMLPAVTNVGVHPTVGKVAPQAESYILDYSGDLYGKTVPVSLVHFLRPEKAFSGIDALRAQIKTDADAVRNMYQKTGRIRAVLFDFDDTLTKRDLSFAGCCRLFLKRHFPMPDGTAFDDAAERLTAASHHGYLPFDRTVYDDLCKAHGVAVPFEEFSRFLQVGYPISTVVVDDARPTLEALRKKGLKLGVLTNGSAILQNRKLDISGLRPLFDGVTVGGEEGVDKPHAAVFERAAMRLGVPPEDCLFVGDNVKNDIEGSLDAGMQAVFVDHGYPDFPLTRPVPRIRSLMELPELI